MYAYATETRPNTTVDFAEPPDARQLWYWRKHPNLHGWMERLYREKGGEAEDFNLRPVLLTTDDLDALEIAIRDDLLPPTRGFFFGASDRDPEQIAEDLAFCDLARDEIRAGRAVFYTSWW